MNILVTCGGGFQGLTLQKELSSLQGVRSYVIDINKNHLTQYLFDYSGCSPYVAEEQEYIQFLKKFCLENKIRYIIPATAIDSSLLSRIKKEFKTEFCCDIVVPDYELLTILSDKKLTTEFLYQKGISVQWPVNLSLHESFPVIGKYRWGWGGKGITVFKNKSDYLNAKNIENEDYIWFSYLTSFKEYSIDFSVNIEGKVSKPVIRTRDFVSGGFSIISSVSDDIPPKLNTEFEKIAAIFSFPSFNGIYNIQILLGEDFCYVTDVNPRIGTSAVASCIMNKSLVGHIVNLPINEDIKQSLQFTFYRSLQEKVYYKKDFDKVRNIVFDLDDTLISNRSFTLDRCKILYEVFPNPFKDKKTFVSVCEALLAEGKAAILIDEICRIYNIEGSKNEILHTYRKCFPEELEIYRDVENILAYLKKQKLRLFVLTDNPVITQKRKWDVFPLSHYFHAIEYSFSLGKSKPDIEVFSNLLEKYGGESCEYTMVGDNYYRDSKGAINAGFAASFHIHRKDGMVSPYFKPTDSDENIIPIDSLNDLRFYF